MIQACRVGDLPFACEYLRTRPLTVRHRDTACIKGNLQLIQLFYYLGYDISHCLLVSCTFENCDIVDFILPTCMRRREIKPEVLDLVINIGNSYIIDAFISKNIRFNDNCIHSAAAMGDVNLVNKLYTLGYDLNYVNTQGENALFAAVDARELDMVQFLLDMNVDIDQINEDGQTCLHYACNNDDKAMVQLLQTYGCMSINDRFGDQPVDMATDESVIQLFNHK